MEWANSITGIITAIIFAIGIPLALRKRKKEGPQNVDQLAQHLRQLGINVTAVSKDAIPSSLGSNRSSFKKNSVGLLEISGHHVSYINVIGIASQYGVKYYLEYLVQNAAWAGRGSRKKTRMVKKKSSFLWGKVTDIQWKGDYYLAQQLNLDYRVRDAILQSETEKIKHNFTIYPDVKQEYTRIRMDYFMPSAGMFEAIDLIARYIREK